MLARRHPQATAGVGVGANVLLGGGSGQITLQPVSVEGSTGVNVAAGVAEVVLKAAKQRYRKAHLPAARSWAQLRACRVPPIL